jgi:hypothetical protein
MATLYDIIAELRREHPTPAASKTLDMVVAELGRTRDNLGQALADLGSKPIPTGGGQVLDELETRARIEGIDDLQVPLSPDELRDSYEPVDASQVGIALLLGGSAVLVFGLAIAAFVIGLSAILRSS